MTTPTLECIEQNQVPRIQISQLKKQKQEQELPNLGVAGLAGLSRGRMTRDGWILTVPPAIHEMGKLGLRSGVARGKNERSDLSQRRSPAPLLSPLPSSYKNCWQRRQSPWFNASDLLGMPFDFYDNHLHHSREQTQFISRVTRKCKFA